MVEMDEDFDGQLSFREFLLIFRKVYIYIFFALSLPLLSS